MVKRITYRIRFYILLTAIPMVLLLSWKLAFSQTVQNYRECRSFEESASRYPDAARILAELEGETEKLNTRGQFKADVVDEYLLEIISKNAGKYHLTLEKIPEMISEVKTSYTVQTYSITFSGRYLSHVKFIDFLESELIGGSIISVRFTRTEKRNEGEKLFMEIYYQLVFKNK